MSIVGTNLAIVAGSLSSPPAERTLPSGDRVVNLEVTVRPPSGPAESVPVAWLDPPDSPPGWEVGTEVVVVGRVRRRFFRAGGSTQSRTEVVASTVIPARRRVASSKAVLAAIEAVRGSAEG